MDCRIDWWKWLVVCAVSMMALSLFCRCSTKQKVIDKQTFLTDKKDEKKWDSLFQYRMLEELERSWRRTIEERQSAKTDKTYIKDSTASRFDANGKKVGEDKYYYERHEVSEKEFQQIKDSLSCYKTFKDSAIMYRNRCDSLTSEIRETSKDKEHIEKQLSRADRFFLGLGKFAFIILIVGTIVLLSWIYWKPKLHK